MTSQPQARAGQELEISKYQYGGTGMSIIDASVFTIQELFELEERYKFLEDIWLSHVVLKRGWDISRLFVYFDDHREASLSGQFNNLKEVKNEFFAKLKYLQCGNGKLISQKLERWSPAPKNDMVNAIEEQVSFSINLIIYLILSVCLVYSAMYLSQKRKSKRPHLKSI